MLISEVSKTMNISADTLRYYEKVGLIPDVKRNKSGVRDYSEDDLIWINFAKCMRSAGLSIEVLTEYLKLFKEGDSTLEVRKDILVEERIKLINKISEIQTTLERLDYKISTYEEKIANKNKKVG